MTAYEIEQPDEACPACGIRGWVWIHARTGRSGCQACGECFLILIDAGEGVVRG